MKKIRLITLIFLVLITFMIPVKSYATEVETTEEITEEITEESTPNETDNNIESTPDESAETSNTEINTEESSESVEIITEELTSVPTSVPEKEVTNEMTTSTYGWLKFVPEIIEITNDSETIIEFEFTNKETGEIITKKITSNDNFSNVVKLPLGEYSVKLINEKFEEYVIYEKEVKIDKKEINYSISINIVNTENKEDIDVEKEKENAALDLLKNNFVFLILLIGCGGFLLIRELKKNN